MSYFPSTSITQNVKLSQYNNSTANLAAGATFTGGSETTLEVVGIQINFIADQDCSIYLDQSMDGTNWDIVDQWDFLHTKTWDRSRTFQATASYFRIRVTNTSALATGYLRLQTALCPLVECLPRALSDFGNLKVEIDHIANDKGSGAELSLCGDLMVASHSQVVGAPFNGATLDTNYWTTTGSTGSGSILLLGGYASASTGTTANSIARITSLRSAVFTLGSSLFFRGVFYTPAVTGSNTRRWGAYDNDNGYFFSFDGTNLSCVSRKAGVDTPVISGSFNGVVYGTSWNPTIAAAHMYEIHWNNFTAYFSVDGEVLHTMQVATTPLVASFNFKARAESINTLGTVSDNRLGIGSMGIHKQGGEAVPMSRYISAPGTYILKSSAGTLKKVVLATYDTTMTIYDNTSGSGTVLLVFSGYDAKYVPPVALDLDLPFTTGLTIVTAGTWSAQILFE